MTQYLLSVHSVDGEAGEPMAGEQIRQSAGGYSPAMAACAGGRIRRMADVSCGPEAARSRRCRRGTATIAAVRAD